MRMVFVLCLAVCAGGIVCERESCVVCVLSFGVGLLTTQNPVTFVHACHERVAQLVVPAWLVGLCQS